MLFKKLLSNIFFILAICTQEVRDLFLRILTKISVARTQKVEVTDLRVFFDSSYFPC